MARFLNHSCSPNLDIVTVMVESHDVRIPRLETCLAHTASITAFFFAFTTVISEFLIFMSVLFVLYVLYRASECPFCNLSHYDSRVAFFSADAIPAKVELCYDYGYYEGNVEGKSRKCLCGAIGCRNVLY